MPVETAATPKPWRNPLGEACGPSSLPLADAMHSVEGVEQGRGDGHGTIDAGAALFQALDHQHAGGEIHAIGGEGECFGEAAAGIGEGHAEGSDGAIGPFCLPQEGVALADGEVFPGAVHSVQLHAGLSLRGRGEGFRERSAGSRAGTPSALAGVWGQRPHSSFRLCSRGHGVRSW
jgi:hypothetical protein